MKRDMSPLATFLTVIAAMILFPAIAISLRSTVYAEPSAPMSVPADERDKEIFRKWHPSVCKIRMYKGGKFEGHGTGALVVLNGRTLVLTAGHLVKDYSQYEGGSKWTFRGVAQADKWTAVFKGGREYDLKLLHVGESVDVAFFALEGNIRALPTAFTVAGKNPEIGSDCWLIGFPLWFGPRFGKGIVTGFSGTDMDCDIAISPGNSGSSVFDEDGRVLGISVAVPLVAGQHDSHIAICVPAQEILLEARRLK